MSDTKEKIKVMQAFLDGKIVEYCMRDEPDDFERLVNPIWDWSYCDYWIKEEPEYIPFDESDAGFLLGKIGIDKKYLGKRFICEVSKNKVWFRDSWVYFQQLFEDYTFLDGTPCGKLK